MLWCSLSIRCVHADKLQQRAKRNVPIILPGHQESYFGYTGFAVSCLNGFPVLELHENEYMVQDIFYRNQCVHVYNAAAAAALRSSWSDATPSCLPRIRSTTLPQALFDYVNAAGLRLQKPIAWRSYWGTICMIKMKTWGISQWRFDFACKSVSLCPWK